MQIDLDPVLLRHTGDPDLSLTLSREQGTETPEFAHLPGSRAQDGAGQGRGAYHQEEEHEVVKNRELTW